MKVVDQTVFGDGKGNCFSACVASILEIPIEVVPNFCVDYGDQWYEVFERWCDLLAVTSLSYCFPDVDPTEREAQVQNFLTWSEHVSLPVIITGSTPRGLHCVIYFKGKLVHDPNPNAEPKGVSHILDAIMLAAPPAASSLLSVMRRKPGQSQLFSENDPVLSVDEERWALKLLQRGVSIDDVAAVMSRPRGSIARAWLAKVLRVSELNS